MDNQLKSKSLILQRVVSKNPEKILFFKRCPQRLKVGEQTASFLKSIIETRGEVKHLVLELGIKSKK